MAINESERWDAYWADCGAEHLLAAKRLLDLSPTVRADVKLWFRDEQYPIFDDNDDLVGEQNYVTIDWTGWADHLDDRPFSSTESKLAQLVASLTADRPILLRHTLGDTGSWETELWRVLVDWGTGGNNRDLPGRATVTSARRRPVHPR